LPKKDSTKWRLIADLSPLNKFIFCERFRMDTTKLLLTALSQGMFAARLDLKDAYLHVPIHASKRRYLRFGINNCIYE
jgi:hypothetical protein